MIPISSSLLRPSTRISTRRILKCTGNIVPRRNASFYNTDVAGLNDEELEVRNILPCILVSYPIHCLVQNCCHDFLAE